MTTEVAGPLEGEVVVVTGVVEGMLRHEVDFAISQAGGFASDTVTAKTTLLVVGDRPGATKLSKAAALGVSRISEAELRSRLRS